MIPYSSTGPDHPASRMHILVLPSWYPTAYAPLSGSFFSEQAAALARAGHRVGVIHPDQRSVRTLASGHLSMGDREGVHDGVTVYRHESIALPKLHAWNGRRWVTSAERMFARYAAEQGLPDVLHAQGAIWAGVAASRISRSAGVPFVLTEHSTGYARGLFEGWYRPFLVEAFGSAHTVVAVSESLRRHLVGLRAQGDIRVVPNSVDTALFSLPPRPRSRHPFGFVCIAILDAKKAVDLLLEAFAAAFSEDAAVRLDIVGDGPEAPRLRRLTRDLELTGRVTFHGARDRLGVRDALWSSHCCVSPSHVETFGVTLIEALATGIPVVATRSGGPEDIVSAECGILTAAGSASGLAEALRRVYSDRDTWRERADSLRAVAEGRFGQQVVAERMGAIYRSAANRNVEWPTPH